MHRNAVFEKNDAKRPRRRLAGHDDFAPTPDATVLLNFAPERVGGNRLTPVSLDMRPFPQHLLLEVSRRLQSRVS